LFVRFVPWFKMYSLYCSTYEASSKLLEQLLGDKKFAAFHAFLNDATAKSKSQLPSFLISPIQRVPRYKLLLDEMKKNTEVTINLFDYHTSLN
jgi:FYVE/RhoGEF/PH domain-containing protein 3